jgi:hypothetical protein
VAYFPELQHAMYSLSAGSRSDGEAILHIGAMKGFAAETWMGFLSADEKDARNSVYTGEIESASAQSLIPVTFRKDNLINLNHRESLKGKAFLVRIQVS